MKRRQETEDRRRAVPPVHGLLETDAGKALAERWGLERVADAIRRTLDEVRERAGRGEPVPDSQALLAAVRLALSEDSRSLRPIVNATGVILHTNLGRAPLARAAAQAAAEMAGGYSNLEYDLALGGRGDRYAHCASRVCELTGSEAALIVNNNAAAVSLVINSLALGRDVIVSRGELVEIGGGFRLPDVIERSGGHLRAVGTTNRTRLEDYRRAVSPSSGLLLKVHPSNYTVEGFSEETSLQELVELGRASGLPVAHDLGSGLVLEGLSPGLPDPVVRASVSAGPDLVTWSGDKLFGGPQAGIIHGRSEAVARLRNNPLIRAFRVDRMTLAALEMTLEIYRSRDRVETEVPVIRMLIEPVAQVEARARRTLELLRGESAGRVSVRRMTSVVGGGSAPGLEIPSAGWELLQARSMEACLRSGDPPVIGRIEADRLLLDFRTVPEGQESVVADAVGRCLETR